MINLVEYLDEDQKPAPCKHGNIVVGHACYCHNPESPYRKCPIWRSFGENPIFWHDQGNPQNEEWEGGCPMFTGLDKV